jgi:hypothetical protein
MMLRHSLVQLVFGWKLNIYTHEMYYECLYKKADAFSYFENCYFEDDRSSTLRSFLPVLEGLTTLLFTGSRA